MANETRSKATVRWFNDHKGFCFFCNLNDDDILLNDVVTDFDLTDFDLAYLDIIPSTATVHDNSSKLDEKQRSWLIVPAPSGFFVGRRSWNAGPQMKRRNQWAYIMPCVEQKSVSAP
ncbi:hypothetical protein RHSIM_Rhsim07G0085400 [Rhododendron simsii]|uniref:Uncharacterized protein n=1 Tax=Rhododendron simsii TaxID=118357 RepID=A0A834GPW9_RHOSS|nr:hypothetical protein RHSIM_Rhsim07G0085400 [Rhododendron simsii]